MFDKGSSPRVRGTPSMGYKRAGFRGIIPACAGNTGASVSGSFPPWDHPRVCGEHIKYPPRQTVPEGSSPRVRGTLAELQVVQHGEGIIPACAGNTGRHAHELGDLGDHPRVCGEHPTWSSSHCRISGSSPRVRGTHSRCTRSSSRFGIIPACAGNTVHTTGTLTGRRDHPRVCGEHPVSLPTRMLHVGSSPRVRG